MVHIQGDSSDPAIAAIKGVHASTGWAVHGETKSGTGAAGTSEFGVGVWGHSNSSTGTGGVSVSGSGVHGLSESGAGLNGHSDRGPGLWVDSLQNEGIHTETKSNNHAAIAAVNMNPQGEGAAIYAEKYGAKGHAGFFVGNVHVTGSIDVSGDLRLLGADLAEAFSVDASLEVQPGSVMVLNENGDLTVATNAYDRAVTGVISGAGNYRPGVLLDQSGDLTGRVPIALVGKVNCLVDTGFGAIHVGDLLTTSPTPGHAMRADDQQRAFGAILGKALRPLRRGERALLPVLVCLQ